MRSGFVVVWTGELYPLADRGNSHRENRPDLLSPVSFFAGPRHRLARRTRHGLCLQCGFPPAPRYLPKNCAQKLFINMPYKIIGPVATGFSLRCGNLKGKKWQCHCRQHLLIHVLCAESEAIPSASISLAPTTLSLCCDVLCAKFSRIRCPLQSKRASGGTRASITATRGPRVLRAQPNGFPGGSGKKGPRWFQGSHEVASSTSDVGAA